MPLPAAAIGAGATIVSSLFGGLMDMKMQDEKLAQDRAMFEKQKEAKFQEMYAQQPMQAAQLQNQGIQGLVSAWGGTRR